jgi:FkbM family methyltransferase
MTPSLSIVIPVYNEPDWISVCVADAVSAVRCSPFADTELIVVDDGSDEPTKRALAGLDTPLPTTIVRQRNSGRFAARRAGVEAATGELVLLLDARVSIGREALDFVASGLTEGGELPTWNAHVEIELEGNPYARLWNILSTVAFRDYLDNPRTTSYGLEEFDRYPKGTTCFLAPREELLSAIGSFRSHYDDLRTANDDTPLIRALATRKPINISPGFSCLYRSRDSLRPFLRHAYHRGTVFVDGYGRRGTRFFGVIAMFYPVSALAGALALVVARRRPGAAVAATMSLPLGAAGAGVALKRPRADVAALATLGPAWLCVFAAGMWRGLWLALRAKRTRHALTRGSSPGSSASEGPGGTELRTLAFRAARMTLNRALIPLAIRSGPLEPLALRLFRLLLSGRSPTTDGLPCPLQVQGLSLWYDPARPSITIRGLAAGAYEQSIADLLGATLRPGMVVLDVGAHIGYFSLLAAKRVGPTGRVWSFEPDPANRASLERNIDANEMADRVSAVAVAVAATVGEGALYRMATDTGSSTLHPSTRTGGEPITVTTTSLDAWAHDRGGPAVDFVKIDAEGAEGAVLAGMTELFKRNPDMVVVLEFQADALEAAGEDPIDFLTRLRDVTSGRVEVLDDPGGRLSGRADGLAALTRRSRWRPLNLVVRNVTPPT